MPTPEADAHLGECVAFLLGRPAREWAASAGDLSDRLAQRDLALVAVAEPATFAHPGPFLARFGSGWAVLHGVPPGVVFDPRDVAGGDPIEARVVVPLEPAALPAPARAAPGAGRVELIAVAGAAGAPMQTLDTATLDVNGIAGDRYAAGSGTFSGNPGTGRALTLIEREAIDGLEGAGITLAPEELRRNVLTRGIDLDALMGRRFSIGDEVVCIGRRRCEPCAHLDRLTSPGTLRALVHRGGLRADVERGGSIAVGDPVTDLGPGAAPGS